MPDQDSSWPVLPTETEIYILPDGQIVVADLPAELAAQLSQLKFSPQPDCTETVVRSEQDHVTDQ